MQLAIIVGGANVVAVSDTKQRVQMSFKPDFPTGFYCDQSCSYRKVYRR
ncbi:MAG: hypothetical protein RMK18_05390 [Armatimonadota bacterium]|nr:hypothetical protein [Armatimonadota bacterium]MCX7777957.1 hypothetical protein [Armatimonadota bacterium]MDW8025286.1 hypothetical protein [Armatimonadota bacterium]